MFEVSEKFKNAVRQNTRKYEWYGSITTKAGRVYEFSAKDIVKGSGYIKWQCCSDTEIELGTVYAAEMGITLFSEIDRYTLEDAVVRLYYSLTLLDGTIETIPMGIFEISEANRKARTLEIKAYDYMLRFEKTLKIEASSGTPYQFLKMACDACKVEMAQTVAQISDLPNGKRTLGIYADNDMETFRDLIFYVAQLLGCFCQIDRYGKLVLKQYGNTPVWNVPQKERYDSSYSDFVTRYTAISSTNQINQTAEYIAMETDDALTMNLGVNPLMQFGLKSVRETMLREILAALQKVNYVPFDSSTIGNPALEVGDILKFSGGHADETKISCITSIECKINGKMSLKCVGKNPRLAYAKSKNDKNISGLINSVESGKTIVYSFVNVSPFVIGQSLTDVMDIDFTSTEETTAAFQCEMLLEVKKPAEVVEETDSDSECAEEEFPELSIIYKMNNETIDTFMPTKTCLYGKHIVTLFFPISKVIENSSNTFSMYLKVSTGTVKIGEAQIRATISGQGLAAGLGDWNGRISINENIGFVEISDVSFIADDFDDELSVVLPDIHRSGISQTIGDIAITETRFGVDIFTDRTWIAEILRTFVLTSTRGNPKYNGYVTVNSNEQFVLRKRHILQSAPESLEHGFMENLLIDTSFLESVEQIVVNGTSEGYRLQKVINVSDTSVKVPEEVDTSHGYFELKATVTEEQTSVSLETDSGFMESLVVNTSEFDGVKGVEFGI
ncbi:MAG: hypothetical protein PUJ52_01520 [Firmicutes bacterium]|nr:hypothetical protein [Bacillota bacterium]